MPVAPVPDRSPPDASQPRLLAVFLWLWVAALFVIPERYSLSAGIASVRPHEALLIAVAAVLAAGFARGRHPLRFGAATLTLVLPLTGAISLAARSTQHADGVFFEGFRVLVGSGFQVLAAFVVAATLSSPQRRRTFVAVVVATLSAAAVVTIHESITERRSFVGLDKAIPVVTEEEVVPLGRTDEQPRDPHELPTREGVVRPSGPAKHPIELSALMALAIPLAAWLAITSRRRFARLAAVIAASSMVIALVLSVSRTGAVATAIAILIAIACNLGRPKRVAIVALALVGAAAVVHLSVPTAADALLATFSSSGEDPSVEARVADYAEVNRLLGADPWLGRGVGAIATYRALDGGFMTLDNQFLLSAAETGVVGASALVLVMAGAAVTAARAIRSHHAERALCVALLAAVGSFAAVCALFDALRFSQLTNLFMIVVGILAATTAASRSPATSGVVA